jgi:hypothetical protein
LKVSRTRLKKEGRELNRQVVTFGAILALVAMVSFSLWPLWQWLSVKQANAEMQAKVKELIEKYPQLKAAHNIALQDGVLSEYEAKEIADAAKEKADPQP